MFRNYTGIGKKSSTEKFVKHLGRIKSYSWETESKNNKLIAGALQAFAEGRPQNIQSALANAKAVETWEHPALIPSILLKVTEKSDDKKAAMELALANVSANDREPLLSRALDKAIETNTGGEDFYALLIKSGANANAAIDGFAETPLVTATVARSPFTVIKLLHDNGADLSEAITTMHSQGRNSDEINRLEHYKQKLEGNKSQAAPVAVEGEEDIRESLSEIKQQLRDLTTAFNALQSRLEPEEAPAQHKKPQQKPAYPSV